MTGTVNGVQKIIGRVIYYMPDRWTKVVSNYGGGNLQNDIKIPGRQFNTMDAYVRTNYRDMEHSKTASGALDDSFGVSLRQNDDGAFNVSITDDDRPLYYEAGCSLTARRCCPIYALSRTERDRDSGTRS